MVAQELGQKEVKSHKSAPDSLVIAAKFWRCLTHRFTLQKFLNNACLFNPPKRKMKPIMQVNVQTKFWLPVHIDAHMDTDVRGLKGNETFH